MVSVHDNVPMMMSGQAGPTALVTIKSIGGLGKSVNQVLAAHVSEALQKELAIPPDRVYLTFEELAAVNSGDAAITAIQVPRSDMTTSRPGLAT